MNINALLMDERDNVVTCVAAVSKGSQIVYQKGQEVCTLTAEDDIPYCHKAALEDLPQGTEVRKYGEMIGRPLRPSSEGTWSTTKISSASRGTTRANSFAEEGKQCNFGAISVKKAGRASATMC